MNVQIMDTYDEVRNIEISEIISEPYLIIL